MSDVAFFLGWSLLVFITGLAVGISLMWKLMIAGTKQMLRDTTPFDLARWQIRDRQKQVDTADTRPGGGR